MTSPLDTAVIAHTNALASNEADAWDVAGDAWEAYGADNDAAFCRDMASLAREGKNPKVVRMKHGIAILHDEPRIDRLAKAKT